MPSDAELHSQYREALYSNLFTGIVYGAYIVVYGTSIYILLNKPGFTSSPRRVFLFGTTTFMFALGIVALVLVITLEFETTHDKPYNKCYYYVWEAITCLMYILCDAICAWRTVVLWNQDNRIIAILVFFLLGTAAAAGYAPSVGLLEGPYPGNLSVGVSDLIVVGPTLATNLLSTGLIAWKAWQRRILVREHLREGKGSVRVDRVFALLIESGLIYCFIWILYWFSIAGFLPNPGFTVIAFISGLYPTLIIILVSKEMSSVEHYSTFSTEMQFTHVPALGPPTDDGVPHQVLTICLNSTSDSTSDSDKQISPTV